VWCERKKGRDREKIELKRERETWRVSMRKGEMLVHDLQPS
jgi:hypothetical protein